MNKRLENAIDKFLEEKRKSDHGEYAEVTPKDMDNLFYVIELLISSKWEIDSDGDFPVEIHITNRHTHQRNHYLNIPYLHKCKTKSDFNEYIRCIMANAALSGDEVRSVASWISRTMEDNLRE